VNKVAHALSRVGINLHLNAIIGIVPDWVQEVLNSYHTDAEATQLLQEQTVTNPNSRGYSLSEGVIRYQTRIWVGRNSALQTKLIKSFHDSTLGGHSVIQATYQRLKKMFY
jgi:hypothetical protein